MSALILLALFIGVPLLEIAVFIEIGGKIGLAWTLAIVVATAVAGTAMLRIQGLATIQRARESMERNELPLKEVFDGVCLIFAGALLLTPGFVTDSIGALLFLPPVRAALRHVIGQWLLRNASIHTSHPHRGGWPGRMAPGDDGVIDGEWEDISDKDRSGGDTGRGRLEHDDKRRRR